MQLNIHLISHPIIKSLLQEASCINQSPRIKNQAIKQLGIFAVYEITRNWLKIYRLNIKQIQKRKTVHAFDPKEAFFIISNSLNSLRFFYAVQDLMPFSELKIIKKNEINHKDNNLAELKTINSYAKIIIAMNQLEASYVIKLLKCLSVNQGIASSQIRLVSINCNKDELVKLSKAYNKIEVYTAQII